MAVEWPITIEGRNEFGDICRKAVRIDQSWERLFDGDLGLSIEDGKTIMTALQSAVVNHEAETYCLFRRVCPARATSELMELTARLGSMMPYRQAASVLAEFLPVEPTETHATLSSLWPDAAAEGGAKAAAAIS